MKKIIPLLTLMLVYNSMYAQTYSAWITDSKHPTLKVRYKTVQDKQNYNYIQMEIMSTTRCRLYVTSSYCNADARDKNGWQYVALGGKDAVIRRFKIFNSCTNGFWWWYKDYKVETID